MIPDILANAGGFTVSYFEWVQDRQGFFWRESEGNERLQDVIERSFAEIVSYAETNHVTNRTAAYMAAAAIERVARAHSARHLRLTRKVRHSRSLNSTDRHGSTL
jgi:glutamate dehydrogenase (NAD(P)+)